MSARTWSEDDPEPTGADRPTAVVDRDGVTWQWWAGDDDFCSLDRWEQQRVERFPDALGPGMDAAIGGRTCWEWEELVGDVGPVREATDEEARHLTVVIRPGSDGGDPDA